MKKSLIQSIWFLTNFRFIASLQPTEEYPVLPRGYWQKRSNDSLISGYHFTCCCHEVCFVTLKFLENILRTEFGIFFNSMSDHFDAIIDSRRLADN